MQTVDVLGTKYKLVQSNSGKDVVLEEASGYCDYTTKTLVIKDLLPKSGSLGDLEEYKKRVIRHELVHAFLFESGLAGESWGADEEIVDWIAFQFPKLLEAFKSAGAL